MWNRTAVCLLLLVVATSARPSKEECNPSVESLAKSYAALHPNTEQKENPEYGEYFESDILLRETKETRDERNPLNAVTNPDYIWPNGIMYYTIQTSDYRSYEIKKIKKAISDLVELTKVNGKNCIQILPRQSETDYVIVENKSGCGSYTGVIGGGQSIYLESFCLTQHGTIMHEFLHAFGFEHEHNRYDRDDWITINWSNIKPEGTSSFEKTDYGRPRIPYDYKSLMHYGAYAFAVDTEIPTIVPRDPNATIGQRITLSALDIERVQILYGCLKQADSRFFRNMDPKWIPKRNW